MNFADTMNCLEHCFQVFSIDTVLQTVLTFFSFFLLCSTLISLERSRSKLDYSFQRWREFIGILLRHQQLATIVLID